HGLAAAVWKRNRAADHLVGMFRVHAKPEREVNGLVEFRLWKFREDANNILQRILLFGVHNFERFFVSFTGHLFWCGASESLRTLPRLSCLSNDFNSHAARRAGNDPERGFFRSRIQIL